MDSKEIIQKLEKRLMSFDNNPKIQNVGTVIKNNDGVIVATGLTKAQMGEMVVFDNGVEGVILNLDEDYVSIILLDAGSTLTQGATVKTTGKLLSIIASESLLGRVINPLGTPLDGKTQVDKGTLMPLEKIAAGVVAREPVEIPMKTGITSIDALFPIGRGQRELIIGDRGLGKTAIAIDTIINQKQTHTNKNLRPLYCVYVAIGQKQSTVAQVIEKLRETGSLDYTIVVAANASDPASLQYLAPYAGTAVAEYLMEKGKDVLIVYDDLSKHAWAYRQISLILKRPAGREAYPGDIFYLHSRLLERAVKLNKEHGGGSITALPVIETQADDLSAYIPTNVISITDGQIFLKNDLFNSGFRPAIDVGNSVSRVGSAAQTGAIKSVAGKLKLELAQYRELAVFSQFGSELDQATMNQLERGKRLTEILKQPQYQPLSETDEVLSIWIVGVGLSDDITVEDIQRFVTEFRDYAKTNAKKAVEKIALGEKVTPELAEELKKVAETFKKTFKN